MKFSLILISLSIFGLIFIVGCNISETVDDPIINTLNYDGEFGDLVAGNSIKVGKVEYELNDDILSLTFSIFGHSDDWYITNIYVNVSDQKPTSNRSDFSYKSENFQCKTETLEFNVNGFETIWIAVSNDVRRNIATFDMESFNNSLPNEVVEVVSNPKPLEDTTNYFSGNISGVDNSFLDGTYDAWCVDLSKSIDREIPHNALVYSSYEDLPIGSVDHPENLDKVNWIINQNYVGRDAICGGKFTAKDVQNAFWILVDNEVTGTDNCKILEILDNAEQFGKDYVPSFNNFIALVLVPTDSSQANIIEYKLPMSELIFDKSATAWGFGYDGVDKSKIVSWGEGLGWYFEYSK